MNKNQELKDNDSKELIRTNTIKVGLSKRRRLMANEVRVEDGKNFMFWNKNHLGGKKI